MALSKEKVRKWVIDYQHKTIIDRYKDIADGESLKYFFEKYVYPPYKDRDEYEKRNEFFRKLVAFYNKGKISKILGSSSFLFAPLLNMISAKMKDLPKYLEMLVELYDLSNELDERLIDTLHSTVNGDNDLTPENYKIAFKKSSTYKEREKQIEYIISLGEYARDIVQKGGIIDTLVEKCPHIPLFTKNKHVKSINEAITLVQTAYRAFKKHKNKLNYVRDICREREYKYLNSMFED